MALRSIFCILIGLVILPNLAHATGVSAAVSVAAKAGGGAGDIGGGNSYEIEFRNIGQNIAKQMLSLSLSKEQMGFDQATFQTVVSTTLVFSTPDPLNLNDEIRQAINSKTNHVIVFNETMWGLLNNVQKSMLALHEYLRFVDVDDSSYQVSTRVDALLSLQNGGVLPTPMPTKIRVEGLSEPSDRADSSICGANNYCTFIEINLKYGSERWPYYASCEQRTDNNHTFLHIQKQNDHAAGPVMSIYSDYGTNIDKCEIDLRYLANGSDLFPVFVSFDRQVGIIIY